ncbi:hypothetical protein [Agrobacterium sp. SORGH_AS_0440]|nr:hypothetical protein [Agrobacterium sp. SORGH_AS_0440]
MSQTLLNLRFEKAALLHYENALAEEERHIILVHAVYHAACLGLAVSNQ